MLRNALFAIALAALAGCASQPPFPISRAAGTNCGDPCAVMQCPGGYACNWNEQCQPRCDLQLQAPQFSR